MKDFFDAGMCARLRADGRAATCVPATVLRDGVSTVDDRIRRTKQAQLPRSTSSAIEARFNSVIPALENHFDLTLTSCQPPQLLVYRKGDYFKPHQDNIDYANGAESRSISKRKVSAVVFLSKESRRPAEDSYSGGALTFYDLTNNATPETYRTSLSGEMGLLVAFRSEVFNEVYPVFEGERYTIVNWFI
jgi:predicted 2-oxoglutarate/Fe(II)-dependent dioxygenase YbiX